VKTLAATTRSGYGSRRIAQALQDDGFAVGRFKARRLMQEAGVTVKRPKKRGPFTTDIRHRDSVAPNVLARQFDVAQPNEAWAGDITYLWTAEG
jgi:transposase InsO family protein